LGPDVVPLVASPSTLWLAAAASVIALAGEAVLVLGWLVFGHRPAT
jgi:hypothetical protein